MRTLILTGPESESQRAIAQALKAALAARGGSSLTVHARALLGQHPALSLTRALEEEALPSPRGFLFLSAGGAFQRDRKRRSFVYECNALYAQNLRTLVAEGEFDAVLCLHRYPAEAVAYLRKTLAFSAHCCFVAADYARVPFLEETALDVYFIAHEDLTEPYARRGLATRKIVPAGIPLPASCFRAEERADARALLNLPQGKPCYLIQSAPDPAAAATAMLARMKGEDGRVCVVTPEADAPRNPFAARFPGEIRVIPVPPDDEVALYRNACDVLITSPVGVDACAAAVSGVALVLLPPNDAFEAETARFFAKHGMGRAGETLQEAAELAFSLNKDAAAREQMLASQQGLCRRDAAERIARYLHEGKIE